MESLFHEEIARGTGAMKKLWGSTVIVCGAGALGGNLLENLAKSGLGTLIVIDDDRIEKRNISTQPYGEREIGMQKVKALGNRIYKDIANNIQMHAVRLTQDNVCKLIDTKCLVPRVVVDTFDNSVSRQIVAKHCGAYHIPCLHAGMVDGYSEVVWNEEYTLPGEANDDVCDYPLARNLAVATAAFAAEAVIRFFLDDTKLSVSFTLGDLRTGRA